MPKPTAAGFLIGVFGGVLAFGMIWYIWWLAVAGFLGMVAVFIRRSCEDEIDYIVTLEEIAATEAGCISLMNSAREYRGRAAEE
jgi:cytochrome o ubiquinol oxidase subunit 1